MIRHDSRGIDPNPSFPTLPEKAWFDFKVMEAEEMKSKKGLDMVKLKVQVINNPEWNGTTLFHYVTFIPKGVPGEGISVHFRKCLGLPYGGDDSIDEVDWEGKRFKATTVVEEYNGQKSSKIKLVDDINAGNEGATVGSEQDVPF